MKDTWTCHKVSHAGTRVRTSTEANEAQTQDTRLTPLHPQPLPFEETNPDRLETGELFQKDIILTEAQRRAMVLRKGLASETYRWPEAGDGFPRVPYRFADGQ